MRVLISAFAFSPFRGSEPAVGWNIATRLAKYVDVTVLHGDVRGDRRGEMEMETYLHSRTLPDGLSVIYIPPSRSMVLLEKLHTFPGCWMLFYKAYRLWQLKALRVAQQLHQDSAIDVIHQLTYIGYREPGYLWTIGIPFVWGPISGAENIPSSFYRNFRGSEFFRPLSRDLGNILQQVFPGRIRAAAKAASKIFVVSPAEKEIFSRWGFTSECLLETGASPSPLARVRTRNNAPLKIVWSGLFTPRKALPLLITALAQLEHEKWHLTVVGDGTSKSPWMQLSQDLGFDAERIRWMGQLPRENALSIMSACDILVHTGLREGTPHVILEALSLGLPVVCHDAGGMSTAVTDKCGIRVPLIDPNTSINGFADAIRRFIKEDRLLETLSRGAIDRSHQLSWDALVSRIRDTYEAVSSAHII